MENYLQKIIKVLGFIKPRLGVEEKTLKLLKIDLMFYDIFCCAYKYDNIVSGT